ncbi:hypothetical protein QQG55_47500 [Brugia pahangi]|uniref:Uncharacterized protein n=2 Tax=Brugia TaxID=6278 RepID=A0A0N4TM66_BRUPA|nr:unnamed protein product [Brugia pahangi]
MGLCCSTTEQQQTEQFHYLQHQLAQQNQQQQSVHHNLRPNSPYDIRTGIAMMMQQATALAKAPPGMDLLALEAEIRKAKAEGRTVTIANNCIYFDYELVGRIPPDIPFHP